MAKQAKKRKRTKTSKLLLYAVILLIVVLAFQVVKVFRNVHQQMLEEAALEAQVEAQQGENDVLKSDLEKKDDEDFLRQLARKWYGYVEEGERVFKDSNYSD